MSISRFLVGNGAWCSCCCPNGPANEVQMAANRQKRRGCNECAGKSRIAFTAEEIVARTIPARPAQPAGRRPAA